MSKLLEHMRKGYANPAIKAVKEWKSTYGEMGVYQVTIEDELGRGSSTYRYTAILTRAGRLWQQQSGGAVPLQAILKDADIIAAFAGAEEMLLDQPVEPDEN